ncbi:sigma-70 family RNA polymerase sigma factor [Brucella pseudogrignonensis]|uniref:RNA polymerase sigma factor n=1 Tax=Brucella pseudogrignonensis TaxID=419475 RepID=UPI001E63B906|nr:sigma-70 family RNA polymerase sigma factor [Brucella pseudogrignonensis]MCD4514372.1 sigma-70 family RNA polymerase sigma factor [Brucella pseudogrignonensis]
MPAALNAIFQSHRRSLLWTVMRIVRDHQTAEDVTQETYLKARNALENRQIEHVEGFLFQTARNLAFDHQRRTKVRQRYEAPDAARDEVESVPLSGLSAEDELIHRQRQQAFDDALALLPVRARTAWAMANLKGLSYAEISEQLGVSRNTVYNDIKLVMGHCQDALARLDRD